MAAGVHFESSQVLRLVVGLLLDSVIRLNRDSVETPHATG